MGAADSKNHLSNLLTFLVKHMGLVSTNTNFYQNQFTTDLDQGYFIKYLKTGFSLKIFILNHFLAFPYGKRASASFLFRHILP